MHDVRSKSPPWGYTPQSNSRGLPDPPPPPPILGLDIDRCIIRVLIIIYYPGCQRFFFSLEATELSGEAAKASREVARKKYYVLTK